MESIMKNVIKGMTKEEKQRMIQEFMNSMSEEEKKEMIQLMMPVMMKHVKPGIMMTELMENFGENDCKEMIKEMPSEARDNCKKRMTNCLKTIQEIEKTTKQ